MQTLRLSASLVALLVIGALVPASDAQDLPTTTLFEASLGFPYSETFDAGDGDWTASPVEPYSRPVTASSWEWGAPTSGPGAAFSGSNVWATNLAGTYGATECGAILSPPIDLTGAASASVSFLNWRHMDQSPSGSKFVNDPGRFFVTGDGGVTLTAVDPDQAYDGPMTSTTSVRRCFDGMPSGTVGAIGGAAGTTPPGPTYSALSADLSAFAGQTVQFAIAFSSTSTTHRAGWYIDDFAVTVDGVTTVEDFESGDGGFTVIGTANALPAPLGWSWGNATAPPTHDSPLWATNPVGDHGHRECAFVESPPIDLGPVPNVGVGLITARLTWDHWFRGNSLYAAGIVQIGVLGDNGTTYHYVTPDGGYGGTATGTYQDQLQGCLGAEAGDGAFVGLDSTTTAPLDAKSVDLTPFVGSEVTVRFGFTSAWSLLGPSLNEGWYFDNVEVEMRLTVNGPDAEKILEDIVPDADNPTVQKPGWTTGGFESSWSYGVAGADGPEGDLVYATNPNGLHNEDECSWIQSPPIPTAALAGGADLVLDHWWNQYYSTSSGTAWNGGAVFASTDEGATWAYVPSAAYTNPAGFSGIRDCFQSIDPAAPSSPGSFSGIHEAYETSTLDLSGFTGGSTVTLRFVQGSGIGIERPGWYLGGATLGGLPLI